MGSPDRTQPGAYTPRSREVVESPENALYRSLVDFMSKEMNSVSFPTSEGLKISRPDIAQETIAHKEALYGAFLEKISAYFPDEAFPSFRELVASAEGRARFERELMPKIKAHFSALLGPDLAGDVDMHLTFFVEFAKQVTLSGLSF